MSEGGEAMLDDEASCLITNEFLEIIKGNVLPLDLRDHRMFRHRTEHRPCFVSFTSLELSRSNCLSSGEAFPRGHKFILAPGNVRSATLMIVIGYGGCLC